MKHHAQAASLTRIDRRGVAVALLFVASFVNILWTYLSDLSRMTHKVGELFRSSNSAPPLSPQQHMVEVGASMGRVFPPHSNLSWCTKEGYNKERSNTEESYWKDPPKGLLYVKVPKAASSTSASIIHRISRNHDGCDFQADHTTAPGYRYGNRDKNASFLVGSIRDPASRAISRIFFHHVSRRGKSPTDEKMLEWLNTTNGQFGAVSKGQGGFQLRYMALNLIEPWTAWNTEFPLEVKNQEEIHANVERILDEYDFLILVERMDESLVVLQMLLGVDLGDMLTLDSKVQGMYSYGNLATKGENYGCFKNAKATISPTVKEYLSSNVWYAQNYGDYILHAAVNTSLDRTIDALGRQKVEETVIEYKKLRDLANDMCSWRAYFPCAKDGEEQVEKSKESCYEKDFGCGYECIDNMLQLKANQ